MQTEQGSACAGGKSRQALGSHTTINPTKMDAAAGRVNRKTRLDPRGVALFHIIGNRFVKSAGETSAIVMGRRT